MRFHFQQVHRRNLYGADHVRKSFHYLGLSEVSLPDRWLTDDCLRRCNHTRHETSEQVWILPGSVFGSDRWLEQLQQQHSTESANGSSCNSRFSKKDLMAVIEGNFFVRPYSHPVNITDGVFPSFQVSSLALCTSKQLYTS